MKKITFILAGIISLIVIFFAMLFTLVFSLIFIGISAIIFWLMLRKAKKEMWWGKPLKK